jgi:hypothetical protein
LGTSGAPRPILMLARRSTYSGPVLHVEGSKNPHPMSWFRSCTTNGRRVRWTAVGGLPVWGAASPHPWDAGGHGGGCESDRRRGSVQSPRRSPHRSPWSAATISTVAPNTRRLVQAYTLTGLTPPGSFKVRLTAEGTNGQTAVSPVSNAATII